MGVLRPNPCFILMSEDSGKEAKLVLHTVRLRFISLKLAWNSDTMSFIQDFERRGGENRIVAGWRACLLGGSEGMPPPPPPEFRSCQIALDAIWDKIV